MPNIKLYVDAAVLEGAPLPALLGELRMIAVEHLGVDRGACQLAAIAVTGLPDQPPVNLEMSYLPAPSRTREAMTAVAGLMREAVRRHTGLHAAIRYTALDASSYLATK